MSGHVFVVRGNLTRFACDAWLVPTDFSRNVTSSFWVERDGFVERLAAAGAARWGVEPRVVLDDDGGWGGALAVPVDPVARDGPRPWLTRVTGRETAQAIAGACDFLRRAAADEHRFLKGREKRLFAVPVVGTGAGGLYGKAEDLVAELLPALRREAESLDVDVAVVAFSEPHWAAAQAARGRGEAAGWWSELGAGAAREATELGRLAAQGRLVVFFGAGVSRGVGVPSWGELLDALAHEAGIEEPLRAQLAAIGALDYAQIVARRLRESGREEGREVCRLLEGYTRYGLAHAALASLPTGEFITTNYDTLFEEASEDAGRGVAVLPYAPADGGGRWLLKMHGCVTHPDDIVLTRESYLRYAERNAALAGIVQAMLITRRMLFLGFSLRDDNFHRIVDAVRRAIRPQDDAGKAAFGTAVMRGSEDLLEDLWKGEIDWIKVPDGRAVEIFLDRLAFEAAQPSYLLDPRFDGLLDGPEKQLRELLLPLVEAKGSSASSAAPWPMVERLLRSLGMRD
jgi:hypothetical protein